MDILYHYTNAVGLQGILESRCLRATDIRFLNDPSEWRHLFTIMSEGAAPNSSALSTLLRNIPDRLLNETIRCYVASFCANGDLLSQWRGYAGGVSGFAIGFHQEQLETHLLSVLDGEDPWRLTKVKYEQSAQRAEIGKTMLEALQRTLQALSAAQPDQNPVELLSKGAAPAFVLGLARIAQEAAINKPLGYKEESEWRVVRTVRFDSNALPELRAGRASLIPYMNFPLEGSDGRPTVAEIKIGPTPEPSLAEHSVRMLLRRVGFEAEEIPITHSSVSFRETL